MKNKKGFTLVELLAVIVVLGIVMGIAAVAITNVLDSTRKNAFVSNAKQYIEGAKSIVEAELVDRMFATGDTTVLGTCAKDSTHNIAIKDMKLKTGGETSPYGLAWDKDNSKVVVTVTDDNCSTFTYAIYLTDGTNAIGTADAPIAESAVDATKVGVVSGS